MDVRYARLHRHRRVFRALTGLRVAEFDTLLTELLPAYREAEQQRLSEPTKQRPVRTRAIGAGGRFRLSVRDQLLLSLVWLRQYPTYLVLGWLFGLSETAALRTVERWRPLLAADAKQRFALPAPGHRSRRGLDALLADTPSLAVVIDSFEQAVQRSKDRGEADRHYSGKQKRHTLKSQVAVDERDGRVVDVADSVPGPTNDLTLLDQSGLLPRLPDGVGGMGDLAYVGITKRHPDSATPRRKPREQPRPREDVVYNTAFARRRVVVEHTIGRMRHYQSLSQRDRHHRRHHTERVGAVAGLVNRQIESRLW